MSLQLAAHHLAAHGRGPDTTLVHMTPKEVASLQALAQQHGGSLTINPKTGLPEAGFLSSILPLVAGAGLTAMGMPAGMSALTVGGGTALATGNLSKGLMAGLGAYGGSSITESLIGSGAASLTPAAATSTANAVPTETAAQIVGNPAPQAAQVTQTPARMGSPSAYSFGPEPTSTPVTTAGPITADKTIAAVAPKTATPMPSISDMTSSQRLDALKAGATGENLWGYAKAHPLQIAAMAAGPLMAAYEDSNKNTSAPSAGDSDRGTMANAGYEYDPGWVNPTPAPDPRGREQIYNRPRYYTAKAADGGVVQHFDGGGSVSALDDFLALQKARAAQAANAPAPVDIKQQFADYLRAQAAPTAAAPTPYHPPTIQSEPTPAVTAPIGASPQNDPNLIVSGVDYTDPYGMTLPRTYGPTWDNKGGKSIQELGQNPWDKYTDLQKAQYFAESPTASEIQQGTIKAIGFTPFGYLQKKFDPELVDRSMLIAQGTDPATKLSLITPKPSTNPDTGAPMTPSSPYVQTKINATDFSGMDRGSTLNAQAQRSENDGEGRLGDRGAQGEGYHGIAHGGLLNSRYAQGGGITALAQGGMYNLGSYSDGGRLLRGPGDGVSDSIPATIGQKQPARLADGEFVVPARIVSEIGNGSTEAGARKLYAMMDRVQNARKATVGKGKVAKNTRADKYLP